MTNLEKFVPIAFSGGLSRAGRRKYGHLHVSGVLLAASGVGSVILVTHLGAGDVADVVALRVFAYVCWLYGALGLWSLLRPGALQGNDLPRLRGFESHPLWTDTGTLFTRLCKGMFWAGMPGVLAATMVGEAFSSSARAWSLIAGCIVYLASLALVLGLLGGVARRVAPTRARWLVGLLLLGPFVSSVWFESPPNLIQGFIAAFGWLMARGGPA